MTVLIILNIHIFNLAKSAVMSKWLKVQLSSGGSMNENLTKLIETSTVTIYFYIFNR